MRNTFIAIAVVVLIAGFIGGFTVARARYGPLLKANSAAIIAKDAQLKKLLEENTTLITKKQPVFYVVKNGVLLQDDNGKMTAVTKDIVLKSGTKIMKDGAVIGKSGSKMKLVEGEFIGNN